jgi:hypothetical protein
MQIADIAWKEVTAKTICNCWYKTGILPKSLLNPSDVPTPSVPISTLLNQPEPTVELKVINSLTQLKSRGVLKQKNIMDLGELLNSEGKQDLLEDISEESVFKAVQLMNDSRQETDMHCEDQVTVKGPS